MMIMDTIQADHRAHVAFYLTGSRRESALRPADELRPALFAAYSDLTRLRYDFPVVLLRKRTDTPFLTLSCMIDRAFEKLAASAENRERVHKVLLRHERAIRSLVAGGTSGSLSKLWNRAAQRAGDEADRQTLARAWTMLDCDGQVLDCDCLMPAPFFVHAWRHAQRRKTQAVRAHLDSLILQLSNIVHADFASSDAARTPQQLQASMRGAFETAFDFDRMSAMLTRAHSTSGLSAARRLRIENVLGVLTSQRFFRTDTEAYEHEAEPYTFLYTSCADMADAYCERLPKMIELAKAMAIAALEVTGEYNEAQHDALFEAYGANGLTANAFARFPDYLLWITAKARDEHGELMELLAGNLPVKVVVQFDDLLEESPVQGNLTLSLRSKQLADLAIGLNNVYVLQSSASNLMQMKERILSGLEYAGAALFCVYSGAPEGSRLPAYLISAAAMECRAFPAYTYDPSAGTDWASRFSLDGNPQPERDWPAHPFAYENKDHKRVANDVEFTLADFMACDPRYVRHYAQVPAAQCNGDMLTVREWLAQDSDPFPEHLPTLMMVDRDNMLHRVIVDAKVIEEARRCRALWHSLQELGGIHNSHATRALARERATWDAQRKQEIDAPSPDAQRSPAPPAPAQTQASVESSAPPAAAMDLQVVEERSRDEAYIDTPRCTTCEECVQINNKMFVYDANKQAVIADINAGTYRQLVEAAEACQVSIIHPGKPLNRTEPGLQELLERAEPFR